MILHTGWCLVVEVPAFILKHLEAQSLTQKYPCHIHTNLYLPLSKYSRVRKEQIHCLAVVPIDKLDKYIRFQAHILSKVIL